MNAVLRTAGTAVAIVAVLAAVSTPARAEDTPGWKDTAELSLVATAGNSETQTFGFKNKLFRAWERSGFELNAGGIRAESTSKSRFATGTATNFNVTEISTTATTAENYYLNGQYNRKITDRFFWYAGAGWDRNEFAGIKNRYTAGGGVGNTWVDRDTVKFRTEYGLTYTKQDDVVFDPNAKDKFLGARFLWAYLHKFGANTVYTNDFTLNDNLDETSDFRADMINSIAVAMNSRLAVKLSLQWLYDNQPSLQEIDLFAMPGDPTPSGSVFVELDDLDTVFTASLVINF